MDSSTLLPFPRVKIDNNNTIGAIFIGNLVSSLIYGIISLQTYTYFSSGSRNDSKLQKTLIFIVWVLETLYLGFVTESDYFFAVTEHGNVLCAFDAMPWTMMAAICASSTSDLIVRGIFIKRVCHFIKSKLLGAILIVLAIATFGACVAYGILCYLLGVGALYKLSTISWVIDLACGLAIASDLILSISLCISFRQRRKQILRRTERIVKVLMVYAINTGLFVAVVAVAQLLTATIMPYNLIFEGIYFTTPGLYFSTLLATLNARKQLREQTGGVAWTVPLSHLQSSKKSEIPVGTGPAHVTITMHTMQGVSEDERDDEAHNYGLFSAFSDGSS